MKVRELIEQLQRFDPYDDVFLAFTDEDNFSETINRVWEPLDEVVKRGSNVELETQKSSQLRRERERFAFIGAQPGN